MTEQWYFGYILRRLGDAAGRIRDTCPCRLSLLWVFHRLRGQAQSFYRLHQLGESGGIVKRRKSEIRRLWEDIRARRTVSHRECCPRILRVCYSSLTLMKNICLFAICDNCAAVAERARPMRHCVPLYRLTNLSSRPELYRLRYLLGFAMPSEPPAASSRESRFIYTSPLFVTIAVRLKLCAADIISSFPLYIWSPKVEKRKSDILSPTLR